MAAHNYSYTEHTSSSTYHATGSSEASHAAADFIEATGKEKKELQSLNGRLSAYIEKVRKLEEQNKILVDELEELRGSFGSSVSSVKERKERRERSQPPAVETTEATMSSYRESNSHQRYESSSRIGEGVTSRSYEYISAFARPAVTTVYEKNRDYVAGSSLSSYGAHYTSAREREKDELIYLNDQLADYIEKVRFLEAQNRIISADLELLRRGFAGTGIESMCRSELETAKRVIIDTHTAREALESDIERIGSSYPQEERPISHITMREQETVSVENKERKFDWKISDCKFDITKYPDLFYVNVIGRFAQICRLSFEDNTITVFGRFENSSWLNEVAFNGSQIYQLNSTLESAKIFDKTSCEIRDCLPPSKFRQQACVAYFDGKLYYIGGLNSSLKSVGNVDILVNGIWQYGPSLPIISCGVAVVCSHKLYVIDSVDTGIIYKLSNNAKSWTEFGEVRYNKESISSVAVLNNQIFITPECERFDPNAQMESKNWKFANMQYERQEHSLVAIRGKLYAIGGYIPDDLGSLNFCKYIEEYNPSTDKWTTIGYCEEPN